MPTCGRWKSHCDTRSNSTGSPILKRFARSKKWDFALSVKHIVMSDGECIFTIPRSNPVNAYTMGGIIRDAGLTIEEFRELL
jgi:hypothetical protein